MTEPKSLSFLDLLLVKYEIAINKNVDRVKASDNMNISIFVTAILYS